MSATPIDGYLRAYIEGLCVRADWPEIKGYAYVPLLFDAVPTTPLLIEIAGKMFVRIKEDPLTYRETEVHQATELFVPRSKR